ncbi:MAG: nitronate monooxygenase, partial [Fimbriimonadaceae bacterium]|nr:nitronate monooxygenase [Alphaproteobacteria bacterium]
MTIHTKITRQLKLSSPVILAPMAGVSGGKLASAVSDVGGLGFIGGGYCNREQILCEMDLCEVSQVGVGFITWALAENPSLLDEVLERKPRAIFLSFGDIEPFVGPIKQRNVPLFAQVQTLEQAQIAARSGADFIVAQGTEAGGHGAARATMALVPEICDALPDIPIIAAGGITDGRGLAASLMLGAAGVVCGTAFFAASEALSHPNARDIAVNATGDSTSRSSVFDIARGINWPKPWNLRAMKNRFSEQWAQDTSALEAAGAREQDRYAQSAATGDFDTAAVIVGEGVGLVRDARSASEILQEMISDAERLLASA